MTLARALITQAGPYMVAAKARALTYAEVGKGCDGRILPLPVALEPAFHPIMVTKDLMALQARPCWIFESPPQPQELLRYRVWLSPDQPFSWNCLELFVKQLSLVSHRVGLEITGNRERLSVTLLCHRNDIPLVTTAFLSKLKFCRLSVAAEKLALGAEPEAWENIGFYDYFPPPPYYHLLTRPDELHASPYEALVTAMANVPRSAMGIYQVLFQPVSAANNWHRNIEVLTDLEYMVKLLSNAGHTQRYAQQAPSGALGQMAGDVETKAHNDKPFFTAVFRVAILGVDENREDYLQSLGVFSSLFQHGGRPLNFITQSEYRSALSTEQIRQMFLLGLTYRPGFLVNSAELTGLVHFPTASIVEQLDVPIDTVDTLAVITPDKLSQGNPIGTRSVAGQEYTVCIPDRVRLRHTHLIGRSDMGKSTLEENMVIYDIMRGHGVAVIDPHRDMVERLLRLLPEEVANRVVYFEPGNLDCVPLWNPLQRIPGQDIGVITDDLIGVLKSFVTGWGDRMEHLLRQAIFGLLHLSGSTLRDVYDLLVQNTSEGEIIRQLILETVQNDLARQFWMEEFPKYKPDELSPPKHKLSKLLLSDAAASLMLSQPHSAFNFRRIMDDGMIFLADFSSNFGTEVKEVLGGFIVATLYIAALSRSDMLREERRPFHIYLDEAYQFVTDKLEEILAQTRKYGVSLTLAHQYFRQFDEHKIGALGTVGTTVVFNTNTKDAGNLSKDFRKKANSDDFINLEQGEAIVRCGTEIAKIKTLGPLEIPEKNFKDRIIAESRRKYCMPASEVRRIIEQRYQRPTSRLRRWESWRMIAGKPFYLGHSNMMNSDLKKRARETIERIMAELEPDQIKTRFDDPIAKAAKEFDYEPICPITHKEFHRIVAGFVEQACDKAVGASWMLTDPLARAIWLLETGYQSAEYGIGYIAALLDANDPAEGGIQTVLTSLAESIKGLKRQEYTTAVFTRYLHGCSWRLRCEIARVLLEGHRAFLPERLGKCAPAQLADEIPSLISMVISSDSVLHQMALSGVV